MWGWTPNCSDYKYRYQMLAEETALDRYGRDFYDLSSELQDAIYQEAIEVDTSRMEAKADALNDEGSND